MRINSCELHSFALRRNIHNFWLLYPQQEIHCYEIYVASYGSKMCASFSFCWCIQDYKFHKIKTCNKFLLYSIGSAPGIVATNISIVHMYMMHTIHRIDPVGCFWLSVPLHPVFTVARPKPPILTVESSCKKISTHTS